MELNHLKYFHAVVKEGSFTRAAKVMRIQQPTISKMVRSLEEELGVVLLERYRSGVHLTHAGGEIFKRCEEIFQSVEEIKTVSGQEMTECQGALSFGLTDSAASTLGPMVLDDFLARHPKVRPSLFSGASNLICNELIEGRVEFGLFFTIPNNDDFFVKELMKIPFQVVISNEHKHKAKLRSQFIISRDIDYPKSRPFPVLEMLKKNKVTFDVAASSNNLDSQKQMVLQGLGVALLPRFMIKSDIAAGTLSVLYPKKEFAYSLKLVTRKRWVLSKNAETFLEFFNKVIGELI
jgi:DNA-binding transcriptional LysR family regulator